MKPNGFSLVEILAVSAIMSVVVLAIASLNGQLSKQQGQAASLVQLSVFQSNLVTLVKSNASWGRTIQRNASMACLRNSTSCVGAGGNPITDQPFAIYDASTDPNPFYNASLPTNGLTMLAVPCATYGSTQADNNCVLRFDLKWSAVCTPPNCTDPQVKISGQLLYNANSHSAPVFNTGTYSMPTTYRTAR